MKRRFVVFISSTFKDLEIEREKVIRGLLSIDCFPAGMEYFPANDDEAFKYIKKIIDDCDYYLLVLAGKYGSEADDGYSYTEKEYDYASSINIPIIALPIQDVDKLPYYKVETEKDRKEKLQKFREKVCNGRTVKFWNTEAELEAHVVACLLHAINDFPRPGLIRNDLMNDKFRIFLSSEEQHEYFITRIASAQQVHDLTWAKFGTRSGAQSEKIDFDYKRKISEISKGQAIYDEIFIFSDGYNIRQDRIKKLKHHYEIAKRGEKSNYSCAYYEGVDFPRLQFQNS